MFAAALVGLACAVFLLAAWPDLPMAWDEGSAILRARGIARWFAEPSLERERIARDWQYTTTLEGHPALGGMLIAAGDGLASRFVHPLTAARLGPILLFALAAAGMFYRMRKDFSLAAAACGVTAMMVMPRLLAHAHFATWDGPLTSCWILAWATFPAGRRGWKPAVVFGIVLGMTLSTKATGWLAPLLFIAWAAIYRDRAALWSLAIAVPVALGVFVLLNPPLWHDPAGGLVEFLRLNLNRGAQPGLNISTQFLGRMYNLDFPLPWYNTLLWTAIAVPLPILLFACAGLAVSLRHPCRSKIAMLLVFNWLVLVVARAVPGTPPHDGIRLFLPSFAFLAALAGMGAAWLIAKAGDTKSLGKQAFVVALIALGYLGSATSVYWYRPNWLSYYNLAIGGLHGATARGMEPTYYWDALDESVIEWLHQNTSEDEKIRFAAGPRHNLQLLQEWNLLRREYLPSSPGKFRWYVLQHRPSGLQPQDQWLIANRRPVLRKTLGPGGWWAWRRDVPLVEVYAYPDHEQARRATEEGATR